MHPLHRLTPAALLAVVPLAASAQGAAPLNVADLKAAVDILWIVLAGALVFFMQAGFAFLESGMTRAKNAINVIMKNYCDMCFGALAFWAIGYGLMFGSNPSGWFGTDRFAVASGTGLDFAWLFFQIMFAATAATIVSGAIAERARFSGYVVGSIVITAFIYPLFGAWTWGSLYEGQGWLKAMGYIDFAGSGVVHLVGGLCALAALIVVKPRLGRFDAQGRARYVPGHNMSYIALGGFILWLGWFGFNGGSTLAADVAVGKIVLNTHLAGAAGALGAMLAMRVGGAKILMTVTVNGSIGGLVAVTAGCATMDPPFAILTGFVGGVLVVLTSPLLERLRIDDVVGAVPVHAVGGAWGVIAAGLFKSDALFNGQQVLVQAIGVGAAVVFVFPAALLAFWLIDRLIGLRASALAEQRGLDFSEHYEVGYPEFQTDFTHAGKDRAMAASGQ